jgi:hypothetical protein
MQEVVAPEVAGAPAQTEARTFCLIIFPMGIEESITGILDEVGVPGFTQLEKVTGRGQRGRHFDTPIWPGADYAIFTVTTPPQAAKLSESIVDFGRGLEQQSRGLYGVHVFTWPCQQAV